MFNLCASFEMCLESRDGQRDLPPDGPFPKSPQLSVRPVGSQESRAQCQCPTWVAELDVICCYNLSHKLLSYDVCVSRKLELVVESAESRHSDIQDYSW